MNSYSPDQFRKSSTPGHTQPALGRSQDEVLEPLLNAEADTNDFGQHLVVRQWYSTPHPCEIDPRALRLLFPFISGTHNNCAYDPDRWMFLDIETTGITKGKGTHAFLVGMAWWESGGLRVEQLFMRDHDEEHSVLLKVAQLLKERPVLVTFNGKSCDWRLLEMRFHMTKEIDVPSLETHLDFFHPARHLWRLKLDSLRLAALENCILNAKSLGWSREKDIDPTHIPSIYFDYLRGGPTEPLGGVFFHNRMDLRGLAALAGHILRTTADVDSVIPRKDMSLEFYGLARLLVRNGEYQRATSAYERAIVSGLPHEIEQKARHELARLAKRHKDFDRAVALWSGLCEGSSLSLEAHEQLAIHYERRVGDILAAERVTRSGIAKLRDVRRFGLIQTSRVSRLLAGFERRLNRLESVRSLKHHQTRR
jgi:uncharacterized protein